MTVTRDVYVRHADALPVRVVDRGLVPGATDTSDFTDVQKLTLDGSSEPALELADHPGAERRIDDSGR